jgi:hypothetical protein
MKNSTFTIYPSFSFPSHTGELKVIAILHESGMAKIESAELVKSDPPATLAELFDDEQMLDFVEAWFHARRSQYADRINPPERVYRCTDQEDDADRHQRYREWQEHQGDVRDRW